MISAKSAAVLPAGKTIFKFVDRKYRSSIVLIPGWASDHRIFSDLDIGFNYLTPVEFSPFTFIDELLLYLKKNNIGRISLFGWSLGGFLASEFAGSHPGLLEGLYLVGVRRKYEREGLEEIKRHLNRNKRGYLYKFYSECFSKKEEMRWFKESLFKSYCEKFDLDYLLKTLDYLGNTEIVPQLLTNIENITIIHGRIDRIAPIEEAVEIKNSLPQARFVSVEDAGHAPFLSRGFKVPLC